VRFEVLMVLAVEILPFGMWHMLSHRYLTSVSEELPASAFNIDEVSRFLQNNGKYLPYKHHIPTGSNLQLAYGPNFLKAFIIPLFFYSCKIF
jgi:hypothetical protein